MSVRIIPAQIASPKVPEEQRNAKTRVAAYCRVSTDFEEQENSFASQVRHYMDYIDSHASWTLAGIYADEGLSGTGTKKREQFNAMITDCEDGKIDLVITKSISRFARNTLDCLQYIRKLKALEIPILFEKENINTMDASGEILITILASLAQQESQSISQNVRMGHQYRMQQGKPMVTTRFMGYRMSPDKSRLVIVPEQAVVVRRIFREFLDGRTAYEIADGLMQDGVKSPSGQDKWYPGCIDSMLQNEKFMGDLLLQKWYVRDVISHKAVPNNGKFPKYYVENAHDPIVPKEIFLQVKGELLKREHDKAVSGKRTIHRSGLPFYEKIICGECGNTYKRFFQGDEKKADWRCKTRILKGTPCSGRIVKDRDVKAAVVRAFCLLPEKKEELESLTLTTEEEKELQKQIDFLTGREKTIHDTISRYAETGVIDGSSDVENELNQIKAELDSLQTQKHDLLSEKAAHNRRKIYAAGLLSLARTSAADPLSSGSSPAAHPLPARNATAAAEERTFPEEIRRQVEAYPPSCTDAADFFKRTDRPRGPVTEFRDADVERYIEKVVVHQDHLTVVFKAGVEMDV